MKLMFPWPIGLIVLAMSASACAESVTSSPSEDVPSSVDAESDAEDGGGDAWAGADPSDVMEPSSDLGEPPLSEDSVSPEDSGAPDSVTGEQDVMEPPEDEPSPGPSAEMQAPYFDPDRVLEVDIQLDAGDWDALRSETRTLADILGGDCLSGPRDQMFSWFHADVSVDGVSVEDVGVRKKGYLGSMSTTKPSLKIRFDKYQDHFLEDGEGGGLKWLTLNNVRQDASKLNTCLSYHVFALAGRPAPRCNFAKVSVNGENLGLYVHVESVKSTFLEEHFADASGNLYEGTLSDFRAYWSNTFEKKTNEAEADWSDVEAVKVALADESEAWLTGLADAVDLDLFMTHWALEVMVGHWDGYAGNRNNFYIYKPPGEPFVFIPWGPDSSFTPIDNPFNEVQEPQSVMAHGGIAYRLYQTPETRAQYLERLIELFETVWDEEALNAEVDRMVSLIETHGMPQEVAALEGDLGRVRSFINGRRAAVSAEVGIQSVEWPFPLADPAICWEILGEVDLTFESNWGTLETENFMAVGAATITTYELAGEALTFSDSGVLSGPAEGHAALRVIHSFPDGSFDLLALYIPYPSFSPGKVVFDGWSPPGHRLRFGPPDWQPEYVGRIDSLELVLDEAATIPNAPVSGRLRATIYGFGGYLSGSGSSGVSTADIGLVINEVAAKGEPLDWFELYNQSDAPIDLSTLLIADDLGDEAERVPFLEGTSIAPGEYLVIELDKEGWPGFALGADEELGIWTEEGALVDSADWGNGASGESGTYARIPDVLGAFEPGVTPTKGAPNG